MAILLKNFCKFVWTDFLSRIWPISTATSDLNAFSDFIFPTLAQPNLSGFHRKPAVSPKLLNWNPVNCVYKILTNHARLCLQSLRYHLYLHPAMRFSNMTFVHH